MYGGHGIKALRRSPHKHNPWKGNVICRCGLRESHPIHKAAAPDERNPR